MKLTKSLLLFVALICIALLGAALYLQYVEHMQPCPLCIIQRYAFAAIAVICIVFAFLPAAALRFGAALATLVAIAGAGAASWHLWVMAHPGTSCGIDPLETTLNNIPTAKLLPFLFTADGLCATPYPPVLGLSIPQWSLIWFLLLLLNLGRATLLKRR
jgi:disulfide bond formation protein DsbB